MNQEPSQMTQNSGTESPHVRVQDVKHTYHSDSVSVKALADINLSLSRGSIASIVGASGCGKSTLLRIISGLQEPTAGRVCINGEPIDGIPESVGVIFQDYENSLMKWKSVFENVKIGAEMRNDPSIDVDSTTEKFLKLVGLEDFADTDPNDLSGGMKQRVQFARVLAYDPDVLLCDEPFGALDAQTKEKLQDEFLEILDTTPKTTVFVTHDIEEGIYIGDDVYAFTEINPGQIGRTIEINIERPRYPRTEFQLQYAEEVAEKNKIIRSEMGL
jgi:NitT/TauT family transport system ATP-binding protein